MHHMDEFNSVGLCIEIKNKTYRKKSKQTLIAESRLVMMLNHPQRRIALPGTIILRVMYAKTRNDACCQIIQPEYGGNLQNRSV